MLELNQATALLQTAACGMRAFQTTFHRPKDTLIYGIRDEWKKIMLCVIHLFNLQGSLVGVYRSLSRYRMHLELNGTKFAHSLFTYDWERILNVVLCPGYCKRWSVHCHEREQIQAACMSPDPPFAAASHGAFPLSGVDIPLHNDVVPGPWIPVSLEVRQFNFFWFMYICRRKKLRKLSGSLFRRLSLFKRDQGDRLLKELSESPYVLSSSLSGTVALTGFDCWRDGWVSDGLASFIANRQPMHVWPQRPRVHSFILDISTLVYLKSYFLGLLD